MDIRAHGCQEGCAWPFTIDVRPLLPNNQLASGGATDASHGGAAGLREITCRRRELLVATLLVIAVCPAGAVYIYISYHVRCAFIQFIHSEEARQPQRRVWVVAVPAAPTPGGRTICGLRSNNVNKNTTAKRSQILRSLPGIMQSRLKGRDMTSAHMHAARGGGGATLGAGGPFQRLLHIPHPANHS